MPNGHTVTPAQHAAIARLEDAVLWTVAAAYRARRHIIDSAMA